MSDMLILGVIIAFFLGAVAFLSYLGYRSTRSSKDYLVGGNSVHPFVMAMSYGAAFISTSAIVGFGGMAGLFGLGLLWLPFMNIAVGVLIACVATTILLFGYRFLRPRLLPLVQKFAKSKN